MIATTRTTQVVRPTAERRACTTVPRRGVPRIRLVAEVVALLVIALLLIVLPVVSREADSPRSTSTTEVIAQSGDTLWSVAQTHPIPGMTTAQTADHIAELNGIESSRILAGSAILVPVTAGGLELASN